MLIGQLLLFFRTFAEKTPQPPHADATQLSGNLTRLETYRPFLNLLYSQPKYFFTLFQIIQDPEQDAGGWKETLKSQQSE